VDAVRVLEQDHHEIELLFDQYERAGDDERARLINRICREIEAHTRLEEEMFYPAVRSSLGQDGVELVDEALGEHRRLERHISGIRSMQTDDSANRSMLALLMDGFRHHVDEEESEMFPLVRASMEPQLGLLGEALEQQRRLFAQS
jgi:hemerythrin-like domain-containing protein